MNISEHDIKDIILRSGSGSGEIAGKYYYLDIVIYTEDNKKQVITLFSKNKKTLEIKKVEQVSKDSV